MLEQAVLGNEYKNHSNLSPIVRHRIDQVISSNNHTTVDKITPFGGIMTSATNRYTIIIAVEFDNCGRENYCLQFVKGLQLNNEYPKL